MNVQFPAGYDHMALADRWSAHNYHPLPVVLCHGEGAWVTDITGRRYLDFLSGYSALNFGHRHPVIIAAANSGAEAVEAAVKIARKWAYEVKRVPAGAAEIIAAGSNFHGRTTTIVVPYGDIEALRAAITPNTAALLLEPIQGEAGVIVPPEGYFAAVRRLCDETNTLFIADEIQSGLARAGSTLALEHEGVRADLYLLGKALGGGVLPVSAVVGRADVIGVLKPGEHGSTFGGNPLACAVGRACVRLLATGEFQRRSRELGAHLHARLAAIEGISAVSGRGLWATVHLAKRCPPGRQVSEALLGHGLLCKDYGSSLRIAPPLVITREELDQGLDAIARVLN